MTQKAGPLFEVNGGPLQCQFLHWWCARNSRDACRRSSIMRVQFRLGCRLVSAEPRRVIRRRESPSLCYMLKPWFCACDIPLLPCTSLPSLRCSCCAVPDSGVTRHATVRRGRHRRRFASTNCRRQMRGQLAPQQQSTSAEVSHCCAQRAQGPHAWTPQERRKLQGRHPTTRRWSGRWVQQCQVGGLAGKVLNRRQGHAHCDGSSVRTFSAIEPAQQVDGRSL